MRPIRPRTELGFDARCVELGVECATWQDAVRHVGGLLSARGFATPGYAEHMVEVIERFGPYMVVAPGVALVHARPERDTLANGVAAITLAEPVSFGHAHFDPVSFVMGLAVTRPEEHLTVVAALANALDEPGVVERAVAITEPQVLVDRCLERIGDLVVTSPAA